jgi:hypothetical protein
MEHRVGTLVLTGRVTKCASRTVQLTGANAGLCSITQVVCPTLQRKTDPPPSPPPPPPRLPPPPTAGGKVEGLALPERVFPCATPAEVRSTLPKDVDVLAFQCRNPIHR